MDNLPFPISYNNGFHLVSDYMMFTCQKCGAGFSVSYKEYHNTNGKPKCPFCDSENTKIGATFNEVS